MFPGLEEAVKSLVQYLSSVPVLFTVVLLHFKERYAEAEIILEEHLLELKLKFN